MSRWFRFYDDAINDPKILKLPEASRWHWTALLCIASKNDGVLPPTDDVALMLRVKPAAAAAIIATMKAAGLIDLGDDGKFSPHNWNGRQYKSDTSNERVKRYRQRKCNVTETVTVTPPETETETETETEADTEQKQIPEANASGAEAPDPRKRLFGEGLAKVRKLTGKGQDASRSLIGKLLGLAGDDAVVVLGLLEDAERNEVVDLAPWCITRLKQRGTPARATTVHQAKHAEGRAILDELHEFNASSSRGADSGLLRQHPSDGPESIRGGPGGNLIELSASRDRPSG